MHTRFTDRSAYTTATCECDQPKVCNAVYQRAIIPKDAFIPGDTITCESIVYKETQDVSKDAGSPCYNVEFD